MNIKLLSLISSHDTYLSDSGYYSDIWRPIDHHLTSTTTMVLIDPLDALAALELIEERVKLIMGPSTHQFNMWTSTMVDLTQQDGWCVQHDLFEVDLEALRGATSATIIYTRPDMAPWEVHEALGLPPLTSERVEGLLLEADAVVRDWVLDHYRLLHAAILTRSTHDIRRLSGSSHQQFMRWWNERASGMTSEAWAAVVDAGITEMLSAAPSNPWRPSRP